MPTPFLFRIFPWIALCLAVTMTQNAWAAIDANTAGAKWCWSPYRVGLCLAVDDSVVESAAVKRDTMAALMRWQSNWLNGICDFQPEPMTDFDLDTLRKSQEADFPPTWEQYDKLFLIVVTARDVYSCGGTMVGWSATLCEFDVRTRIFGENRQIHVGQLSQLPEHLFREITETLTPIARIVRVDENRIQLEERAGELLAMQDVLPVVAERQVMLPVVRTNDRDGNPQQIRRVDWTFLSVDGNANGQLTTTLHTGLRSPINARMRPRHQQLALLAIPVSDHTTIRFASYVSRDMLLPICDILESVPGRKQAVNIGTTDVQGEFRIDFLPERPVRLLYVRSGTNLIARIPIMPGIDPVLNAELPVADSTLHAESLVLGIQEEVLDTVAMRQILVAQAITHRQRSERKDFDDTLLKLRRLKTQQVFQSELNLLKMQLPYDDPASHRRIDAMLEQTRTLVGESLPPVDVSWTTR